MITDGRNQSGPDAEADTIGECAAVEADAIMRQVQSGAVGSVHVRLVPTRDVIA